MRTLYGTTAPNMRLSNSKKIKIEAARIVTGATKLVFIDSLYTETGWETLSSRRLNQNFFCSLR